MRPPTGGDDNVADLRKFPRAVRQAPNPLGLYIRPARNDHKEMLNALSAGHLGCFGAVFDPTPVLMRQHRELREQLLERRLDAILDPKTQQMASIVTHK